MVWIALAALVLLLAVGVWIFNSLVRLRNQVRAAWADIDVQLLRRHDLVPRLVDAAQAYAAHERALFDSVAALRAQAIATTSPARLAELEAQLERSLLQVFALQEAYPALKASENFLQLQRDLVEVEDHLQYARRFYNGAVRDYNDAVQRVPAVFIARPLGFTDAEFFMADAAARIAPVVEVTP
ncbi:LemA family protein [Chiayiivirga flava]|uniref:LemA protein n=1 Tax=Chiayiivirga flava TaxID=659595 RepID=A0A7W8D7J8_9GAMM|nr:LemA family protein [Chiayiivirga flava]MBB5208230.1 LemA protein [Chiayiivirga flava]